MELKPGYYILRNVASDSGPCDDCGPGADGCNEHLALATAPVYAGCGVEWWGFGDECPRGEPWSEVLAGPFTMAQIIAALRPSAETGER